MIIPEKVVRSGLIVAGLAVAMDVLGCMGDPSPARTPTQRIATPPVTATSTLIPMPDRRISGALLENLDLHGFIGFPLEQNHNVSYSKIDVLNLSSKYKVSIDLNGLDYWAQYCQISQASRPINIQFHDRQPSGGIGVYEISFNNRESDISFAIDEFYRNWSRDIFTVYSVPPTSGNLDNAVNISVNVRFIDGLCASSQVSKVNPALPSPALDKILDDATKEANKFDESLLSGDKPLITAIQHNPS